MNLSERDQQVVWHPFTQMKTAAPAIPIISGKGANLFDDKGNKYIDAISSWWTNTHGHSHPYIAEKIAAQALKLEHVIFANFTHEPAVQLAERLLEKLPADQSKVFYTDNGSTAVEVGLKMCFQYWYNLDQPKTKIIAFKDAYHGDTFGAMSVGGRSYFSDPFAPFLFDVEFIDTPIPEKEEQVLEHFTKLAASGEIAGFIFEPLILGAGGMLMYTPEVLDKLLAICKQYDIVTIADEVMVGFYRTGKFFATNHCTHKPDIYCLSKGLTGGTMALGVTTCNQKIYDAFYSDSKLKTLFHGHSFTANPIACSAALASMDLFEQNETISNIQRIIKQHDKFIDEISMYPNVQNVRQTGTIIAFDVVTGSETSYFNTIRDQIWNYFISRYILLRPLGNTIYLLPPYCITNDELQEVYQTITAFITELNS